MSTIATSAFFASATLFAALFSLRTILMYAINFYVLIIVAWAILSWFNKGSGVVNDIYQALDKIVSPFVDIFRRFIPTAGGMDFSPFIAIIVLQIVGRMLVGLLPF
jgi:YggT family protein